MFHTDGKLQYPACIETPESGFRPRLAARDRRRGRRDPQAANDPSKGSSPNVA